MKPLTRDFKAKIASEMKANGMTWTKLAQKSKVSRMHLHRIGKGDIQVSIETAQKILKPLGLELQIVPKK